MGSGAFTLNYDMTSNSQTAALARVTNLTNWQGQIGGGTIPVTGYKFNIDNVGNIVHADDIISGVFSGCDINGTIAPQAGTNLYTVSIALTACANPAVNGDTYTGLATTRQKSVADDTLVWVATNNTYSVAAEFDR